MLSISVDYQTLLTPHPAILSDDATTLLNEVSNTYPWIYDILGVLPVSAFLDVVNPHRRLHICQLVGTVPLWSWTVTPAAYTTLLAGDGFDDEIENGGDEDADISPLSPCHMDGFGETRQWTATDGRYGHQYVVANAETLRRCLSASPRRPIPNLNPRLEDMGARIHRLEIIRVSPRLATARQPKQASPSEDPDSWKPQFDSRSRFNTIVTSGWIMMAGCLGAALKTQCFLGGAYLVIVSFTGLCIQILYGGQPRTLLHNHISGVNRMVLVAEHSNATSWKAFYGDSNILNSLLKHPLRSDHAPLSIPVRRLLRTMLRGLILAQWAVALTAAARKDVDGIVVCFWVLVSALASRYLATPIMGAQIWMRSYAGIVMERYRLKLSSRRSLLSTLVALNPDTPPLFEGDSGAVAEDNDPMGWLDTVWKNSPSRRQWEEVQRKALTETFQKLPVGKVASSGHKDDFWRVSDLTWQAESHGKGGSEAGESMISGDYGLDESLSSIHEGLNMAARVQAEAERLVAWRKSQNDENFEDAEEVEEVKISI